MLDKQLTRCIFYRYVDRTHLKVFVAYAQLFFAVNFFAIVLSKNQMSQHPDQLPKHFSVAVDVNGVLT